ncbi:MAG: hypothetical protein AAB113_07600, partial [Candidatus Eisenbacteria bacterium]
QGHRQRPFDHAAASGKSKARNIARSAPRAKQVFKKVRARFGGGEISLDASRCRGLASRYIVAA